MHVRATPRNADLHEAILDQLAAKPYATLAELRAWLAAEHEGWASDALLLMTLRKTQPDAEKKSSAPANRIARTSLRCAPNGAAAAGRPRQAGLHRVNLSENRFVDSVGA